MSTNMLKAINNLLQNPENNLRDIYSGTNRINSMGEALETYVKDIFCNSVNVESLEEREEIYGRYFSHLGDRNHPPDLIIRRGDAVEVKKISSLRAIIQLNSSYPKSKLYANSTMITERCRNCEEWQEKDIVYAIGIVTGGQVKLLWFIYGDCYAADSRVYQDMENRISTGLEALEGIELSETNELGRVNRVDPLGIASLRIRGIWFIDNPMKAYDYIEDIPGLSDNISVNVIMRRSKYESFLLEDRNSIENLDDSRINIADIRIKSPNNAENFENAKLITLRI